jgi:hypothetical protein
MLGVEALRLPIVALRWRAVNQKTYAVGVFWPSAEPKILSFVAGFSPGRAKNRQQGMRRYLAAAGQKPFIVATT